MIGVTGRKYHGKDSVSRELALQGYKVLRFAGPLKAMLRAFYKSHDLDDYTIERKIEGDLKEFPCPLLRGKTPRFAMQTLGDEWGRQLIAVDLWTESMRVRLAATEKAVVPDCRYPNEADFLRSLGADIWRVNAGDRVSANEHSNHASETQVDSIAVDKEISNEGTLFELSTAVRAALSLPA